MGKIDRPARSQAVARQFVGMGIDDLMDVIVMNAHKAMELPLDSHLRGAIVRQAHEATNVAIRLRRNSSRCL